MVKARARNVAYLAVLLAGLVTVAASSWHKALAADVAAMAPAQSINTFYAALLDIMKQAKRLGPQGRYSKLLPVVLKTFDVSGMMRTAVGPGWEQTSPAQRAALIDAFSRMMAATYAARFDEFADERFDVSAPVDLPPNKLVRTRLIMSNGKAVTLNYLVRNVPEGWKIADVYLDGTISELAARRAEFAGILKTGGPDALVAALNQKADKLLAGS
jgi:phospholipid transport system substrate-binding protein